MRSVEYGADTANGYVPLAAIASERDSHLGFVLRGHVPTVSQAQKMRREKGTPQESGVHSSIKSRYHACNCSGSHGQVGAVLRKIRSGGGKAIVSVLKTGYRYLNKISKSEQRSKYSCTYRDSGAGSEDESRGIIRIGNEQL
ncbi:hypothetical protein DFH09DRAFT_1087443 [Mycena vulgaris]|nr:hypothetical protein DFH09DRAFT_1087443 [Mycena vulgaris]